LDSGATAQYELFQLRRLLITYLRANEELNIQVDSRRWDEWKHRAVYQHCEDVV